MLLGFFPHTLRLPHSLSGRFCLRTLLTFELTVVDPRLKSREPLYGLCRQLNVYGNTPFADLSGAFPASSVDALKTKAHSFTTNQPACKGSVRSSVVDPTVA